MNIGLSTLGQGIKIEGNIISTDNIRIDGEILGDIKTTEKVVVGAKGTVNGNINARQILIEGKVVGEICVTSECIVASGGFLTGKVEAQNFTIMENGFFDGNCIIKQTGSATQNSDEINDLAVPEKNDDHKTKIPEITTNTINPEVEENKTWERFEKSSPSIIPEMDVSQEISVTNSSLLSNKMKQIKSIN